jgi:hypothetical protein
MYTKQTINWKEVEKDIGKYTDREVAKKHGISHESVSNRRRKMKCPVVPRGPRLDFGPWSAALGKKTDKEIADLSGFTKATIWLRRTKQGIPSAKTGDGESFISYKEYCDALGIERTARKKRDNREKYKEFCEQGGFEHE